MTADRAVKDEIWICRNWGLSVLRRAPFSVVAMALGSPTVLLASAAEYRFGSKVDGREHQRTFVAFFFSPPSPPISFFLFPSPPLLLQCCNAKYRSWCRSPGTSVGAVDRRNGPRYGFRLSILVPAIGCLIVDAGLSPPSYT